LNYIVKAENLYKNYGGINAVNGISIAVEKGELFGFVGPDGAGKTTTLRIFCGLIPDFSGNASIFAKDIIRNRREIQEKIGYLSQKFSLYTDLTVDENIEFFAEIHNVSDFCSRREQLLEFTRLREFRNRLTEKLSGGMKQKLALACSLIHKPEILFLDEPTAGVDPVSRRDFWKILSLLQKEGMTVLMSTPYLDEAERCNRVALIHLGKIIAVDTPANVKNSIHKKVLEIVCTPARKAYRVLKENFGSELQLFGDRINILVGKESQNEGKISEYVINQGIQIIDSRIISPTLENVFIHMITKSEQK